MLFWLKKALTLPFLPLHFALLCSLIAVPLLWKNKATKLARLLLTLAFVVLAAASNKGIAKLLISPLETKFVPVPEAATNSELPAELQNCRYVVVLGGGHGESAGFSRINQLSSSALSRLTEGIRILRLLPPGAQLIVSGNDGEHRISHAQVLAEAAISLGVPPDKIICMNEPRDTEDEANSTKKRVGTASCALITSAWHLPRATALFRGAGVSVFPCPADFLLRPDADSGWECLLFDLGSLERSTKAIREDIGLLWTKLRGKD